MPEEFALSLTEIEAVVERTGLPRNWHPYEILSAGHTMTEHRRAMAEAWAALRERGLASGEKLDPDVEDTIRAWTKPDVLIVMYADQFLKGQPRVFYRATIAGGLGVFSAAKDPGVLFRQVKADRLVDSVIGSLPDYRPVPLRELTVVTGGPAPEPADDDPLPGLIVDPGPSRSRRDDDSRAFSQWPMHRAGVLDLSVRTTAGGTLAHQGTGLFFDSEGGRFAVFNTPTGNGQTRRRLIPTNGSHLRNWLLNTIEEARR
ncbi:ESX secretion-associated protein EspG [Amycolatopsis sp. CA-230715]|uniref:ESX secretion-associated protein EspG n=1 Tax=Amycolatopsis sp. CA-230715 TaxID=2745196 RepID=UPI001C338C09|nr:ESX secretion-associated protein EspG [Amycolatopsis sp. CA-230715]QWF81668.1 hypothetical protein HUW46_05101 [Amycolatopsis sp. CA-230715]